MGQLRSLTFSCARVESARNEMGPKAIGAGSSGVTDSTASGSSAAGSTASASVASPAVASSVVGSAVTGSSAATSTASGSAASHSTASSSAISASSAHGAAAARSSVSAPVASGSAISASSAQGAAARSSAPVSVASGSSTSHSTASGSTASGSAGLAASGARLYSPLAYKSSPSITSWASARSYDSLMVRYTLERTNASCSGASVCPTASRMSDSKYASMFIESFVALVPLLFIQKRPPRIHAATHRLRREIRKMIVYEYFIRHLRTFLFSNILLCNNSTVHMQMSGSFNR